MQPKQRVIYAISAKSTSFLPASESCYTLTTCKCKKGLFAWVAFNIFNEIENYLIALLEKRTFCTKNH